MSPAERLNILIITDYFPPEIAAPAHLLFDLSTQLLRDGHSVTVVTGFPRYNVKKRPPQYQGRLFMKENMDGVQVVRMPRPAVERSMLILRGLDHLLSPLSLGLGALCCGRPDVTLVLSPPLPLVLAGYLVKLLRGSRLVANVQDLFPQNAIDLGMLRSRWLIKFFEALERLAYRISDAVTVHSDGNREHVLRVMETRQKPVHVVPNWVDTTKLCPLPRHNDFSKANGLDDRFVVSFAGTMGYSQDMEIILRAAQVCRDSQKDVLFLLVGDGVQRAWVEDEVKRLGLSNVKLMPTQPRDVYPWVLASSDVSVATLKREVETPVVPSKILSIMAAGRPVIAAMSLAGDAPKIINQSGAGIVVDAGDVDGFVRAINYLCLDEAMRRSIGEKGRAYAEEHFSLTACTRLYESIFSQVGAG